VTVYRHISAEKALGFAVSCMCELLEVSTSGYYEWAGRAPSDRALTDAWLVENIKEIWASNRKVYGAPRIHAELRMQHGVSIARKRVERLMRDARISGRWRRSAAARRSASPVSESPTTSSTATSIRPHRTYCGSPT
jgi:putative transposase